MNIDHLVLRSHATAVSKGWHPQYAVAAIGSADDVQMLSDTSPDRIGSLLALVHSEVSEALEAFRESHLKSWTREDGKPEGFASEIADVVIRCADICGLLGINLTAELERKMAFNDTRPVRHGGKLL